VTNRRGNDKGNPLTIGLGAFSVALGAAQLAVPELLAKGIGLKGDTRQQWILRAFGAREVGAGAGIFASSRRSGWMWARVAGDALDLSMLGAALASGRNGRKIAATAAVAGVTVLDVLTALQTTKTAGKDFPIRRSITVNKPVDEVYAYWKDFAKLPTFMRHLESVTVDADGRSTWTATGPAGTRVTWHAQTTYERENERISWRSVDGDVPNEGTVRFRQAPGKRGTELEVELRYEAPGGAFGNAAARLLGEHPDQQVADDLRRFKQILETGQVLRSDGSPDGISSTRQAAQRPAQPIGDAS
jgi:uncharacterized membrane protein